VVALGVVWGEAHGLFGVCQRSFDIVELAKKKSGEIEVPAKVHREVSPSY
jgi:hypothetical protein